MDLLIALLTVCVLSLIILKLWNSIEDSRHKKTLRSHKTIEERIAYYNNNGWDVQSEAEDRIYFIRKKEFSFFWGFLWFLCFGVGLVIYLIYYLSKSDERFTFNKKAFLESRSSSNM